MPTTQWIGVYSARRPMKQSVGCCSNLWALIMDAGTGFTTQVYEPSSYFLHKECIKKQKKNYYTSAIAGSNSGSSFVVMSKRTQYLQQSYKIRLWSLVSCILVKAFIEDGITVIASPQLQYRRRILIFVSI